ncbi:MAG: hypothetical protein AB1467_00460 [Candidatus Diapherotrites archaeon]
MNRKGQITLDFLLALVGAIVFIQIFQTYSNEFTTASRTIGISNQGEAIISDLGQITQLSLAFKDGNINILAGIPFVYDVNKLTGQDCTVSFVDQGAGSNPRYFVYFYYLKPDFNSVVIKKDLNFMPLALKDQNFYCGSDFNLGEK